MNPHCRAFTCDTEEQLWEKWCLIPHGTDILITHSPPKMVLDQVCYINEGEDEAEHVGSSTLYIVLKYAVRPKLHVFGHIHEAYGQGNFFSGYCADVISVNASYVNERYKPVNKPVRVIL